MAWKNVILVIRWQRVAVEQVPEIEALVQVVLNAHSR